jgi:hypothetical protein
MRSAFKQKLENYLVMSYAEQWRDLHSRIRIFWFVVLGYAPGFGLIAFALHEMSPNLENRVLPWIAGAWMTAFLTAGVYRTAFRCPRCGGWYFGGFFTNPYRQKCGHCGLRRWSDGSN